MTDITELIARLRKLDRDGPCSLFPAAADALAAQAQEIERLWGVNNAAEARARELEQEIGWLKDELGPQQGESSGEES